MVVVGLTLLSSGCRSLEDEATDTYHPSSVEDVAGSEVKRVTFTVAGADQVELATSKVAARGSSLVVDYAALMYDGQGKPWVYVVQAPLTFMRTAVVVDRIVDNDVLLSEGPPAGTSVVTVGAAEVYGAELDIEGGH